jgi:hypothetical protein
MYLFQILPMSDDEWKLLREVVSILTPFHAVSTEMEGGKYPTLSLVYPNVTLLRHHLTDDTPDFAPSQLSMPAKKLCKLLLQQLDTRFPIETAPTAIIMATYLDVRYRKLDFLDEAVRLKWKARIDETVASFSPPPSAFPSSSNSSPSSSASIVAVAASISSPPPASKFNLNALRQRHAIKSAAPRAIVKEKTEAEKYEEEQEGEINDPLLFWKSNSKKYKLLARLAKRYLCVPASSAPSERVWSFAGNVIAKNRHALLPPRVCQHTWLKYNLAYLWHLRHPNSML